MLREIISGLLIVLILITGFFSYIILFDVKEIKSPSLTLNLKQYRTEKGVNTAVFQQDFKSPFIKTVKAQKNWLNLHTETNQAYEEFLNEVLVNQNLLFIEEYKDELEDKREELDKDFIEFKNRINKITNKEIEYYSSLVEYEMEQSIKNLRTQYDKEFAEYERQIQAEKRNELLNYRLKLETLDLTDKQAQKYRDMIEEIESEKSIKINNKLNEIYYTLRIRSEQLAKEKEEKIADLKEQFEQEKVNQIKKKKLELEKILTLFQRNNYAALKRQINGFEETLSQEKVKLFQKREAIKTVAQNDLEYLKNTYSVSTEERD